MEPLPVYSPDLTPVEELGSKVKEFLRSVGARTTRTEGDAVRRKYLPRDRISHTSPASLGRSTCVSIPSVGKPTARHVSKDAVSMPANKKDPEPPGLAQVQFLTVAEVATMMRVSKMTVYRLVHNGELPAVRVGKSFRVPEQAVHDYLRTAFIETA